MELHTTRRVETHVVEITIGKPYTSKFDLEVIDTLIKMDIENLEQISKIRAIIPAENCLGLRTYYRMGGHVNKNHG